METGSRVGAFAFDHPRLIAAAIVGVTIILAVLAGLPSLWPHRFAPLNSLTIDTDPENMLPEDEKVRVFHDRMKEVMSLNDMIVLGVVNEKNEEHGVFNPESLEKVYALTEFARGLRWRDPDDPARRQGVVEADMIAPSMVDNVESDGAGAVRFEWLMQRPPRTQQEALEVRRKALAIPFLKGTLVSEDGRAVALYLPITDKDVSHRISTAIKEKIKNPSRLFSSEVGNFNETLKRLVDAADGHGDPLVEMLWQELSSKTRQQLIETHKKSNKWDSVLSEYESVAKSNGASADLRQQARLLLKERNSALNAFVSDINNWINKELSGNWLNPDPEIKQRLGEEGRDLVDRGKALSPVEQQRLKRLWAEAAFAGNISKSIRASLQGDEEYYITGLPVAEDTFGVQMFKQMAISAPLAMLIIFLLMWFFFRSIAIVLPAMFLALISSAATMSLLVVTGNTVHIMSSMIPIFIVPIAVLDDVHVTSEFFDRYRQSGDRRKTVKDVMNALFTPMFYTTLTTSVGFASLALAPIPPVQVFGLFVAFGVIVAWICTILLVPAYIAVLPDKVLKDFGARHVSADHESGHSTLLGRVLLSTGKGTVRWAKPIIAAAIIALVIAGWGISKIRVNDNPTNWFEPNHPIRIADRVLNDHFGGTYMAYLAFRPHDAPDIPAGETAEQVRAMQDQAGQGADQGGAGPALPGGMGKSPENSRNGPALPSGMENDSGQSGASSPSFPAGMGEKSAAPADKTESSRAPRAEDTEEAEPIFKDPATIRWIGALQDYMRRELGDLVGKSNSVTDIVETVHRELLVGVERDGRAITREEAMRVPDTRGAVAQTLLQFQNSHRPQDLWHFISPDHRTAVVWLQLTSGDNRDMSAVVERVNDWLKFWAAGEKQAETMVSRNPERFTPVLNSVTRYIEKSGGDAGNLREMIADSPAEAVSPLKAQMNDLAPKYQLKHDWFGLTHINVTWQEKMVTGMLRALLGSFLAVFLMMTLLYRSALWGILCMAPLTVTIAGIYGLIGFIGKDYDMPVAVLSALSLGLAVDYAIHFLTRSRMMYPDFGSWKKTAGPVFGEPARAITRNAIVVGVGFLPLLFAPLVPYQTVGIFIAAILFLAGVSSLLILPAALTVGEGKLFPRTLRECTMCNRGTCIIVIITGAVLVYINVQQYIRMEWTTFSWIALPVMAVLAGLCAWHSRGEKAVTESFCEIDQS
ncbi:MAG: MMPL family transporter [Desulfobacteraceae bacterium]|nr:MMPL family transporter [Desulfobacteraceae bacterium]